MKLIRAAFNSSTRTNTKIPKRTSNLLLFSWCPKDHVVLQFLLFNSLTNRFTHFNASDTELEAIPQIKWLVSSRYNSVFNEWGIMSGFGLFYLYKRVVGQSKSLQKQSRFFALWPICILFIFASCLYCRKWSHTRSRKISIRSFLIWKLQKVLIRFIFPIRYKRKYHSFLCKLYQVFCKLSCKFRKWKRLMLYSFLELETYPVSFSGWDSGFITEIPRNTVQYVFSFPSILGAKNDDAQSQTSFLTTHSIQGNDLNDMVDEDDYNRSPVRDDETQSVITQTIFSRANPKVRSVRFSDSRFTNIKLL